MARCGLTEKKMQDKRFRRTEEVILGVVFSAKEYPHVDTVAKKAHISRTTFYRHHSAFRKIASDYEKYLLEQFSKSLKRWRQKQKISVYFEQMLLFIAVNKKVVRFLMRNGRGIVIEEMVKKLDPEIMRICRISKKQKLVLVVYHKEILGVIEEWGRHNFKSEEIGAVLDNIKYLTDSLKKRLVGLNY